MNSVEMWFPVSIYKAIDLVAIDYLHELYNHSLFIKESQPDGGDEWYGNTFTTHATYNLANDNKFDFLIATITEHVNHFAAMHNSKASYNLTYAWLNVNSNNTFQEFHTHNDAIFSAVFYIACPDGSGSIVFEDPKEPDMYPLKEIESKNQLSYTRIWYPPIENSLLIFRSYLRHMVEPCKNIEPRISIALNFA